MRIANGGGRGTRMKSKKSGFYSSLYEIMVNKTTLGERPVETNGR
jgi:hypothetical protein